MTARLFWVVPLWLQGWSELRAARLGRASVAPCRCTRGEHLIRIAPFPLSTGSPRGCPPLPRPAHDLPRCGECVNGLRHGVGVRRAGFEAWACCHGSDLSPHILALQDKASVLSDVRVIIAEQLGTDVEKVCCFWQGGVVSLGRITEDSEGRMSLDEPSMQVIGNTL